MVAIDAMGGDFAPESVILGALRAAKAGVAVSLFGHADILSALLLKADPQWEKHPITLIHCSDTISMHESPSVAVVRKKDSSLVRAVKAVAHGHADAVVSAGNSGAALIAGTIFLGRVDAAIRPAIGGSIPTRNGSVFCMDLGANVDCKPAFLQQFALMGHTYAQVMHQIERPRIALLSNGEEPYKGSQLVKESYALLEKSPLNFVGNLEPNDLFFDRADVLVSDGFSGNVMLKAMQGAAHALSYWAEQGRNSSWLFRCAKKLGIGTMPQHIKNKIDAARRGGMLLFGVNRPFVVAHGSSNALAIENAILYAHTVVQERVLERFNDRLRLLLKK